MVRRVVAVLLALAGLGVVGLAIASATVWRPADVSTATVGERPDAQFLTSDAGVLDLADENVTIELSADVDEEIWLTIANTEEVHSWVDQASQQRITGLDDPDTLTLTDTEGEPTEDAPEGSDLWVEEFTSDGSLSVEWDDQPGRWSLLATTDSRQAPTVSLTWPQAVTTPWLIPGVVVGGILILGAIVLLMLGKPRRRDDSADSAASPDSTETDEPDEAVDLSDTAYAAAPAAGGAQHDPYAAYAGDTSTADYTAADVAAATSADDIGADDVETRALPPVRDDIEEPSDEEIDRHLPARVADLAQRERDGEPMRRAEKRELVTARADVADALRRGLNPDDAELLREAGPARGAGIVPASRFGDSLRHQEISPGDSALLQAATPPDIDEVDPERKLTRRQRRALERQAMAEDVAASSTSAPGSADSAGEVTASEEPSETESPSPQEGPGGQDDQDDVVDEISDVTDTVATTTPGTAASPAAHDGEGEATEADDYARFSGEGDDHSAGSAEGEESDDEPPVAATPAGSSHTVEEWRQMWGFGRGVQNDGSNRQ